MPGFLLHVGATLLCAHGGQAQPTVPNPRVTVSTLPTVTIAAALMNSAYQVRNFSWMMLKRRFGIAHATRAEVRQMALRWMRNCLFAVWKPER